MPVIWRVLGYGGNGVLLVVGLLAFGAADAHVFAVFLVLVALVNLYLIRKIDLYSREEVWLQAELHKRELRRQIEEFDAQEAAGADEPKRLTAANDQDPPR